MPEDILVQCCAPTLAGLKTGSLFSCPYESREELDQDIRNLNRCLSPKGLCVLPMRYSDTKVLLYIFRPARLTRDLKNTAAMEILSSAGYRGAHLSEYISLLMKKLRSGDDFPHEIGLFLSYPPEDVRGFIENKARNSKLTGVWKVYGDEREARKTFEKYRKCTASYCRSYNAGFSVEKLAVAV